MRWVLLAFLIVPAAEIGVFLWAGGIIGPWWVVGIILLTGIIGVTFAKYEGAETWNKARESMNNGQVPGEQIVDGICIFVGAVFLFTPGFITDLVGFLLVLPWSRVPFKIIIIKFIKKIADKRNGTIIYRKW